MVLFPGWITGTIVLISYGLKFAMILKKIVINVLTCQFRILVNIKVLKTRKTTHAPFKHSCVSL